MLIVQPCRCAFPCCPSFWFCCLRLRLADSILSLLLLLYYYYSLLLLLWGFWFLACLLFFFPPLSRLLFVCSHFILLFCCWQPFSSCFIHDNTQGRTSGRDTTQSVPFPVTRWLPIGDIFLKDAIIFYKILAMFLLLLRYLLFVPENVGINNQLQSLNYRKEE